MPSPQTAQAQPAQARRRSLSDFPEERDERPAILLHSCCAPCSASVIERLSARYRVTVFFCNPNIDSEEEHDLRLEWQRRFVASINSPSGGAAAAVQGPVGFAAHPYAPEEFQECVRGLEDTPEGGERCRACIGMRLERTAAHAAMNGFDVFTTTLPVSPHKDFGLVKALGAAVALRYRLTFLAEDFGKQGGFARSCELAKRYGMYRQDYCGCRFSKAEAEARRAGRG